MFALQRSALQAHIKPRPSKRLVALQVESGQCFSILLSHAAKAQKIPNVTRQQTQKQAGKLARIHQHKKKNKRWRLSFTMFALSHQEHQPLAGHWRPHRRPHSIPCSCSAALTRSRCLQWRTCYSSWESLGTHTVSSEERTVWTCRQRCRLGEEGWEAESKPFKIRSRQAETTCSRCSVQGLGFTAMTLASCRSQLPVWIVSHRLNAYVISRCDKIIN